MKWPIIFSHWGNVSLKHNKIPLYIHNSQHFKTDNIKCLQEYGTTETHERIHSERLCSCKFKIGKTKLQCLEIHSFREYGKARKQSP